MLTRAGVTTALDMSGTSQDIAKQRLNLEQESHTAHWKPSFPEQILPTTTLLRKRSDSSLKTPLATAATVSRYSAVISPDSGSFKTDGAFCQDNGIYIAWHAGSTENGSDMKGMREAVTAAAGGFPSPSSY